MRWLLLKDLQILRRSPLLVGLLIAYGLLIGALIGIALSRSQPEPRIAFLNEIPPAQAKVNLGGATVDTRDYVHRLFESVIPVFAKSEKQVISMVKEGKVVAGVVVPADTTQRLKDLVELPGSSAPPTVNVYYSGADPLLREGVEARINSRLADANDAIGHQIIQLAGGDLDVLLNGGAIHFGSSRLEFLGLKRTESVLGRVRKYANPRVKASIDQVLLFARRSVIGLGFSKPALASIDEPLRVHRVTVDGQKVSLTAFGAAIAPAVTLMFVGILLAAGMLALEREENAFGRLIRGLVTQWSLLGEKVALGAIGGIAVALVELAVISLFVPIEWGRAAQWGVSLVIGGFAFGAVGTAIGALTRDVRASSLLAFMIALPFAFLALVSSAEVSGWAYDGIRTISAVFPFRAALQSMNIALNEAPGSLALNLLHLAVLAIAYTALGRFALRRFAA